MRRSALAALLLVAVLPGQALAVSWGTTTKLTSSRNADAWFGITTTGSSIVHVVYNDAKGGVRGVYYRRSGDAGATFAAAIRLSSTTSPDANTPVVAAYGAQVDVVWLDQPDEDFNDDVLKYRRSTDQGATWQGTVRLGGTACCLSTPSIARDSAGRIIVTWTDRSTKSVMVQISANNGVSWTTPKAIGATNYDHGVGDWDAYPVAAGGTSALYVAWWGNASTLFVIRSTDGGATWGSKATLTTAGVGDPISITATGSSAVVAYTEQNTTLSWVATRKTTNKGTSWASRVAVTSTTSGNPAFDPYIRYVGGKYRIALERCGDATDCLTSAVWYRDSADAVTWSTIQKVSTSSRPFAVPDGITIAGGKTIVMYNDLNDDTLDSDVFVRAGT